MAAIVDRAENARLTAACSSETVLRDACDVGMWLKWHWCVVKIATCKACPESVARAIGDFLPDGSENQGRFRAHSPATCKDSSA